MLSPRAEQVALYKRSKKTSDRCERQTQLCDLGSALSGVWLSTLGSVKGRKWSFGGPCSSEAKAPGLAARAVRGRGRSGRRRDAASSPNRDPAPRRLCTTPRPAGSPGPGGPLSRHPAIPPGAPGPGAGRQREASSR